MRKKCFLAFENQVNQVLSYKSSELTIKRFEFEKDYYVQSRQAHHNDSELINVHAMYIYKITDETIQEISLLLDKLNRKLNKKQCKSICEKCITMIYNCVGSCKNKCDELKINFEPDSDIVFEVILENANNKIESYFSILQFVSYNKLDKAYCLAIISTIIAGSSALISLAGVILSIILK